MSMGIRAFVFDEQGSIKRVPSSTFSKLLLGQSNKALPEYAGKRIKLAMVYIGLENRQPVRIIRSDYLLVGFDEKGRVVNEEREEKMQLAVKAVSGVLGRSDQKGDILESLQPDLANLKYRDKYTWKPTLFEKQQLEDMIF